ncbi:MAG TPA: hypothetical protein VER03_21875 [Bryobacteraceae bacterium]|nr:hypothetical protein [Bryobacteraceae bacterium]
MHPALTAWVVALAMAFAAGFVAVPSRRVTEADSARIVLVSRRRERKLAVRTFGSTPFAPRFARPLLDAIVGTLPGVDRLLFQLPPPLAVSSVA